MGVVVVEVLVLVVGVVVVVEVLVVVGVVILVVLTVVLVLVLCVVVLVVNPSHIPCRLRVTEDIRYWLREALNPVPSTTSNSS